MDKEKTKLRKLTLRSPAERQAAEQRRTSAMMGALRAIHSAASPDSRAPDDLERQRKGQELLGRLVAPMLGMSWEPFDLGGQLVTVREGKATLADGTIAGSVTNLHQEIKNLVSFGVPLAQAVKAATLIPAQAIGLEDEIGSIAPGKRADLVVLDENLEIVGVYHD